MTDSDMCHNSFVPATCLIQTCAMTLTCDLTHSDMCHNSCIPVTFLTQTCATLACKHGHVMVRTLPCEMPQPDVCHDAFMRDACCCTATRCLHTQRLLTSTYYGVATISRLLKSQGLFCKRALLKRRYSAKETYNFEESTNRSHPIIDSCL